MPPLEDANAVQVAVMEIMLALVDDRMDRAKAATLLYACQIAQSNLRNISLAPVIEEENEDNMSLAKLLLRELSNSEEEDDGKPQGEGNTQEAAATGRGL
jgi:hypothetical protein